MWDKPSSDCGCVGCFFSGRSFRPTYWLARLIWAINEGRIKKTTTKKKKKKKKHKKKTKQKNLELKFWRYFSDTNLLDWNSSNLLSVALNQSIYVWNASTKDCQRIELRCRDHDNSDHIPEDMYVSALSWSPEEPWLAIADSYGEITVIRSQGSAVAHR